MTKSLSGPWPAQALLAFGAPPRAPHDRGAL